ncbi:response regulator [Caulobacter sp. DWR2-3-1b2]|uniref:response regulator n=1 Tax=unclassified Caulobacter TaxID=2648921 RepID=UPI0019C699EF|nr:response regulator [Caulobacter sp.]
MTERTLRDCHILVVEDEYLLADELATNLSDAGAVVIGPVATVEDALALIDAEPRIDGAVLDANLQGALSFPVADRLLERGVPFVFTTGYNRSMIPSPYREIVRCDKPVDLAQVARVIGKVIHSEAK